jgi:hypothetical protein
MKNIKLILEVVYFILVGLPIMLGFYIVNEIYFIFKRKL